MLELTEDEFEALVADALDEIPAELSQVMDNVVIMVEDEAPDEEPELLGLYEGTPLTDRGDYTGVLPDVIRLFRLPILRICETHEDVLDEIAITVVHEIAHHFGIDDDRLHELGWA
ncbi:metallopeptidase family protein [Phytoactinopolyspora halotolerans]|uniref:Metallopeptidase family protein n=1 Tax=Phytoactinopolyspora halotolerans TaxID=1981512 RepID=A0A6L9SGV2_9ACTN|nr:metallopeptidase family protein [Phytoactinopolyspora halotolerans]NEE03854.1 metallopeptidase family protein [Phytoactinopolyspora halotolerans]